MKKTIKYILAVIIGCMIFTACEDPYAGQSVAKPGAYDQATLQDPTFTVVLKSGVNPLVIQASQLSSQLSLLTCTAVPIPLDTLAKVSYKLQFSNLSTFATYKSINSTYSGKVNEDVKVICKEFNDSIKTYNKNAVQRPVYLRLIAYISRGGLKTAVNSAIAILNVTPNNYPPVAMNDVATLPMNSSVSINVLSNDTDPEKDVLSVASTTAPAHGTVTKNADGTITYAPTNGFSGADSFTYTISDGNGNTSTATVDITVLAVNPYSAVTPRPWYIIGLANGGWNNSVSGLGVSIYPLSVVPGNKYNLAGDGEFTFTGYFQASRGFKLIRDLGNWDIQWGMSGSVYKHNDGGSGNITVPADGYYTITLNSITDNLTIVPATTTPATYTKVGLIGGFNGWGTDLLMTASESTNNHIWYTTYTFTDTELKFRANADWGFNWGAATFPVGLGVNNGANIPVKAGTYTVIFNDVDGCYYFK